MDILTGLNYLADVVEVVATLTMGYLLWASGYAAFLVRAARANGWGFGTHIGVPTENSDEVFQW